MADDPIATLLRQQPMSDAQRADAWDAYHQSSSADDLTARLQKMPMPQQAKAALWDLKSKEPSASVAPAVPETPQPPQDQRSMLAKGFDALTAPGASEVVKGAVKSGLGMVEGGGKLLRSLPVVGPALDALPSMTLPVSTKPSNPAQQLGKTSADIASFFAPGSALTKVKGAIEATAVGRVLPKLLTSAAVEGAGAAGVSGLQSGSVDAAKNTGLTTAATAGVLGAIAPKLTSLGHEIEYRLLKPNGADLADGFNVGNVFKYGLGGTIRDTIAKSDDAISGLYNSVKKTLSTSPGKIDLLDVLNETDAKMRAAAEAGSGVTYPQLERASKAMMEQVEPIIAGNGGSPKADLLLANKFKQIAGDIGAWTHSFSGKVGMAEDAGPLEEYANTLYDTLKKRLEGNAQGPVKDLNKAISEIMSVRRAAIRRLPVSERANLFSLPAMVGLSHGTPLGVGLTLTDKFLKSARGAQALVTAGESGAIPALGARAIGTATNAVQESQ